MCPFPWVSGQVVTCCYTWVWVIVKIRSLATVSKEWLEAPTRDLLIWDLELTTGRKLMETKATWLHVRTFRVNRDISLPAQKAACTGYLLSRQTQTWRFSKMLAFWHHSKLEPMSSILVFKTNVFFGYHHFRNTRGPSIWFHNFFRSVAVSLIWV